MPGNSHIPTAPADVIGDVDDLREIRDALRAGKRVVLNLDGKVYVSTDAGAPMTAAGEDFIESKLGHVIAMARSGYGVSIRPDGTISADRADHLSKVLYDPDPALSEQQRLLIQRGVAEGAMVRVHSDGRVEYFLPRDARRPSAEDAAGLQAAIDAEITSGRLAAALQAGESLSANPDGSLDYVRVEAGPEPVPFPEDPSPPATADELAAAAEALELGAAAARFDALDEFAVTKGEAARQHTDALRRHRSAEAGRDEALVQVAHAEERIALMAAAHARALAEAASARDAGDVARAAEHDEDAQLAQVRMRVAEHELQLAKEAVVEFDRDAERWLGQQAEHFGRGVDADSRQQRVEDVFDAQERQAAEYRRAAELLREAERLEAALPDLEARGVPGTERIRAAIAAHRRDAVAAADRGHAFDAEPPAVAPDPADAAAPDPADAAGPAVRPAQDVDDVVGPAAVVGDHGPSGGDGAPVVPPAATTGGGGSPEADAGGVGALGGDAEEILMPELDVSGGAPIGDESSPEVVHDPLDGPVTGPHVEAVDHEWAAGAEALAIDA